MKKFSVNYETKGDCSVMGTFGKLEEAMKYVEAELKGEVRADEGVDPYTDLADCFQLTVVAYDEDDEFEIVYESDWYYSRF